MRRFERKSFRPRFFMPGKKTIPRMESEILLALGIIGMRQSDTRAAAEHLAQGLHLAVENEHFHFMILGPADAARACVLALEVGVDSGEGHASRLLKNNTCRDGRTGAEKARPEFPAQDRGKSSRNSKCNSSLQNSRITYPNTGGDFRLCVEKYKWRKMNGAAFSIRIC